MDVYQSSVLALCSVYAIEISLLTTSQPRLVLFLTLEARTFPGLPEAVSSY